MCEVIPSLPCFHLTFLKLFFWDDFLKLLQGDHSYALNSKKIVDQIWPHMGKFNGPILQQRHQRLVLSLNPQIEK